jgi:hypothetical protein
VYYFKDTNVEDFTNICWDNDQDTCSSNEFVSTYAQKNKEEDYAESFAYWYMSNKYGIKNTAASGFVSRSIAKINDRLEHFDKLFNDSTVNIDQ